MLILVTGATSGIGKSTAEMFAMHGHNLIITGRRQQRLKELEGELTGSYKVKVLSLCFDIRNHNEVKKAIDGLDGDWKAIDVLVNNAGLAAGLSSIQDGDISHWDRMVDTNVKGLIYITRYVSNLMIKRGRGHIINIGSVAGKEVYAN